MGKKTERSCGGCMLRAAKAAAAFIVFCVVITVIVSIVQPNDGTSTAPDSQIAQSSSDSSDGQRQDAETPAESEEKLVVRFVDVGQGDGSIIEFPDGKTMLIDTGEGGAENVISTLREDNVEKIDWLIATHPDSDHTGGLPEVMESTEISTVWAPRAESTTRTYTDFLNAVKSEGLKIKTATEGKTIAEGEDYSVSLVWPPKDASYTDTNDMSAMVDVMYGQTSYLFAGDAPAKAIMKTGEEYVDVLKVSHHGSASGTTESVAETLTPEIAVISYGADNEYGHPAQSVLDALESVSAKIYGTAVNGTVTVTSDGTDVEAETQRAGTVVAKSADAGAEDNKLHESEAMKKAKAEKAAKAKAKKEKAAAQEKAKRAAEAEKAAEAEQNRTVYVTPSGTKYHQADCRTLSRSSEIIPMKLKQAEASGYTACSVCGG